MQKLSSALIAALVAILVVLGAHVGAPVAKQTLGALAGPDIASPYLKWGSLATYQSQSAMQTATTTLCAIQGPSATSTLRLGAWQVTTGTSTSASIDIGIGSTAYATTTTLVSATSLSSGAQGAAAYAAANGTTAIVGPNQYLIVKTNGAGLGGYTYTGTCDASFTVL